MCEHRGISSKERSKQFVSLFPLQVALLERVDFEVCC